MRFRAAFMRPDAKGSRPIEKRKVEDTASMPSKLKGTTVAIGDEVELST